MYDVDCTHGDYTIGSRHFPLADITVQSIVCNKCGEETNSDVLKYARLDRALGLVGN